MALNGTATAANRSTGGSGTLNVRSDQRGFFELDGATPGRWMLEVTSTEYDSHEVSLELRTGTVTEVLLGFEPFKSPGSGMRGQPAEASNADAAAKLASRLSGKRRGMRDKGTKTP